MSKPLPGDPALHAAVVQRLDWLARPCAGIELAGPPVRPGGSQLLGHPYLPAGQPWPHSPEGPCLFLVQIDFAEVPPLPGFPTRGLLQWFTNPDDTYGLTFDETAGATGFQVRWYADPSAPSVAGPLDPTPADGVEERPMDLDPAAIRFRAALSLPEFEDLPEVAKQDPIWGHLAAAYEDGSDPMLGYGDYARGGEAPYERHEPGSKVGGFPSYTQEAPFGSGAYPPPGHPASALLIELDALDTDGWGDSGIAHLFGDPAALARGDLGSIRYHWDCY